jgi:hypothetical protein
MSAEIRQTIVRYVAMPIIILRINVVFIVAMNTIKLKTVKSNKKVLNMYIHHQRNHLWTRENQMQHEAQETIMDLTYRVHRYQHHENSIINQNIRIRTKIEY